LTLQVRLEPPTTQNAVWIALGHGHFAIVDDFRARQFQSDKWYARKSYRKFYAVRSAGPADKRTTIAMHRVVANTPHGEFCHHHNRNTLDNRQCNLLNSTDEVHRDFHHIPFWKGKNWQKKR
jgi:hypothetical protein